MRNDINLIPKRNRIISAKMMSLILAISVGGIILMLFYGLLQPLKEKNEMKNIIAQKQEELLLYNSVEDTFITLTEQINKIKTMNSAFETLKSNTLKMTQIFQDFQKNIPEDITIQTISYSNSNGELLMEGVSPTYKNIAQYIVKLRQLDDILGVVFTSAELENPEVSNGDKGMTMHKFSIKVSLKTNNSTIAVPDLQEGDISDKKEGE